MKSSAAAVSSAVHLISQLTGFENWAVGDLIGMPAYMNGVWYVSLLTIGVAFIAGKGGFFFIVGGYVCYWILAPVLSLQGLLSTADTLQALGQSMPNYLRISLFRPVGIGMLIGGALTGIALALPLIVSAIRSMQTAAKLKVAISKDEMPIRMLYLAIGAATILLFVIAVLSTKEVGIVRGCLMALLGTLWIWMAGVILSECIRRTNWSPLSGMTLIAITILIFISSGIGDRAAIISSVMVGAAACVANEEKSSMNPYDARHRIDELFFDDLNTFVEARESISHVYGIQNYADVMSDFAAGERYLNRVWSASADGYIDEVQLYIERSHSQFKEALQKLQQLKMKAPVS